MFTIMLVLLFRPVGAQTEDAFPSYIEQCFNNYFNFNPQEKIYLHTDKPTYSAGENIWFRAYCVDASYHIPTQLSKFIYLELINRQDSILKRIQIKQTDSCFYGNLTIPSTTPPGEYCLRVFTNWMQNNEEDFFFKKNIQIVSTVNEVNIHTASSRQDNAIRTTLTLIDNAGKPYVHQRLKITTYRHKLAVNKTTLKTDEQGSATLQYPVSDSIDRIQVAFPTDLPFAFSREIPLLNLSDDFDFQFFPEGGNLLAGTTQTVAFKALDANGRSIAAEGKIYNSKEQEVVSFSTFHRGMGTLELTPQPGERYYALVHTATNREKSRLADSPSGKSGLAGLSSGQPPDPCCQKRNSFSCRENALYRYALQRTSVRRATGKRRFRRGLTPELPTRWYRAVRTNRCRLTHLQPAFLFYKAGSATCITTPDR